MCCKFPQRNYSMSDCIDLFIQEICLVSSVWETVFHLFRLKQRKRRRQWHPVPVLLPGKSHGQRSLLACSPWGRKVLDTTERFHFDFLLSCIGEGNGNSLQCSCLENPRDGGAWWAAIHGVAQSQTRLKRLSSRNYVLSCSVISDAL